MKKQKRGGDNFIVIIIAGVGYFIPALYFDFLFLHSKLNLITPRSEKNDYLRYN